MKLSRREFARAAALGAALVSASACVHHVTRRTTERRDLFPQGVASGDPSANSVILWTRRPPVGGSASTHLALEVATDEQFHRIVATGQVGLAADSDWTARFLVTGLKPRGEYWYRFIDEHGFSSRIGRTLTAPADNDDRPVRFAFASCQMVSEGACNAYRKMIFEDSASPAKDRLGFVLHLGDFIYELIFYPQDSEGGQRRGRRLRNLFTFPHGEKIGDFHIPASLEDYRTVYRAYLEDPDLQDARARWPFICVWDNHEFCWTGWQTQQEFGGKTRPAQKLKVAANQAWWEYIPARVSRPGAQSMNRFDAPQVDNAPLDRFDDHGLSLEPNNVAAVNSLRIFRTLRWGANVELFLTDNHSYRGALPDAPDLTPPYRWTSSQKVVEILDAGRSYNGGNPPDTIRFGGRDLPNPRKDSPPLSYLGSAQKRWLMDRLKASSARWKIWGHSNGTLEWRSDYQNLPQGVGPGWPDDGYAIATGAYFCEKGEIFDCIRDNGITGFAIVAGDRHSFWAGLPSKQLPPHEFEPVGVEFITGSISSPTYFEVAEHAIPATDTQRPLFVHQPSDGTALPAMNVTMLHGVRSALELGRTGDARRARALSNPDVAPHLSFLDFGGNGYATVTVASDFIESEFVCIPRPLERSEASDGGPVSYRVAHRAPLWKAGERPRLEQRIIEGEPPLAT